MKTNLLFVLYFAFCMQSYAQKPILFIGAKAHLGNGKVIENSVISIQNGKFEIVADAKMIRIDPNAFDTIYKVYNKHIYPAFIAPNTTIGLTEIDAVRATHDYAETGSINPNIRSLIAYNTDSKIINTIRTNGILIAQVTPQGGLISGQSSVVYLDGKNWQDAVLKADDGIHINWPNSYYKTGWWAEPGKIKKNKEYQNKIDELNKLFLKAKAYSSSNILDLRMESMQGLFNNKKNLYVHANSVSDIRDAIEFFDKFKIPNITIVGGEEGDDISTLLEAKNISLIINRVHRLPKSQDCRIDEPFTQAKKLSNNKIRFCLSYSGDMEAMGLRNLPFTAGTTVTYGQNYEDAIKSITLDAAKILGIDDKVGSIEKGKEASFFISAGDALDIISNDIEQAFIKGKQIDLNNHQKDLYNKYKN